LHGRVPTLPEQPVPISRPYGVKSRDIRDGEDRFWGYRRDGFEDAFERYLSSSLADRELSKPDHPTSLEKQGEVAGFKNPTRGECRELKLAANPSNPAGCRAVGNPSSGMEGSTDTARVEEPSLAAGPSENQKVQAEARTMRVPGAAGEIPEPPDESETESAREGQRWTL
jgi:hypothetical protein